MRKRHLILIIGCLGLFSLGNVSQDNPTLFQLVVIVKSYANSTPIEDVSIICRPVDQRNYTSITTTDTFGISRIGAPRTKRLNVDVFRPDYVPIELEIPHLRENDTITLYLVKLGFKPLR